MEIWLDTIDVKAVQEGARMGIIAGVTTNPAILAKAGNVAAVLKALLEVQEGPVAVQVTQDGVDAMIEEGRAIFHFSKRCIVKVPVMKNGLEVMQALRKEKIPVMATAVLDPTQALLAGALEAEYIAPYFSHMGLSALEKLKTMQECLSKKTKILAASVKEVKDILACSCLGIDAVTIKTDLFYALTTNFPAVDVFLKKFSQEWAQGPGLSLKKLL